MPVVNYNFLIFLIKFLHIVVLRMLLHAVPIFYQGFFEYQKTIFFKLFI